MTRIVARIASDAASAEVRTAAKIFIADTLPPAARLPIVADANPDPNALHPVRVELDLADGRTIACDVTDVLGSPANPLPAAAARGKFTTCTADLPQGDRLWDSIMSLDRLDNAAALARLAGP